MKCNCNSCRQVSCSYRCSFFAGATYPIVGGNDGLKDHLSCCDAGQNQTIVTADKAAKPYGKGADKMAGDRKLFDQFNYAITNKCRYGADKHAIKRSGQIKNGKIYTTGTSKSVRDTVKNFCNYMNREFPEVTTIKQIKPTHLEKWYAARYPNWTNESLTKHQSYMHTVNLAVKHTFRSCRKNDFAFQAKLPELRPNDKSIKIAMDKEDFLRLREAMKDSRSMAKIAIEVAYRAGLRSREITHLEAKNIEILPDKN